MALTAIDLKVERVEEEELEGSNYTYHISLQEKDASCTDQLLPYSDRNIISQLLRRGIVKTRNADTSESGELMDPYRTSQPSVAPLHGCPMPGSYKRHLESDGFYEDFVKAKRARVENIVCNISSSCNSNFRSDGSSEGEDPVGSSYETPQKEPSSPNTDRCQERSELKHQMEKMRDQLFQLQEKLYHMYAGVSDKGLPNEYGVREWSGACNDKSKNREKDSRRCHDINASKERYLEHQPSVGENALYMLETVQRSLAEALKEELSTAVAQVVDSVVQAFARTGARETLPPVQVTSSHLLIENGGGSSRSVSHPPPSYFDALSAGTSSDCDAGSVEEDQTEALPLVVRKDHSSQSEPSSSQRPRLAPHDIDKGSLRAAPVPPMTEYSMPKNPHSAPLGQLHFKERVPMEAFWEGVSLRTKLSSRHLMPQQCSLFQYGGPNEGTSSGHIMKVESRDTHGGMDTPLYRPSSEGLTPGHLKKAKLMFFYCRYPSSATLKTYFNDVKFNRSITSQLIKWFSNFREFFYIQMEKFSRQAVTEGSTAADRLTVTRDSELARILNQHYNKSSDYEIPAKFLEVSQITLREFFSAVVMGKDVDPSWKKAIYKIICKLDSDIPDAFKSPTCMLEALGE